VWRVGERVRVYRTQHGGGVVTEFDDEAVVSEHTDARDYNVAYYVRLLRTSFAARLVTAFTPSDFDTVFADAEQLSLFVSAIADMRTLLCESDAGRNLFRQP